MNNSLMSKGRGIYILNAETVSLLLADGDAELIDIVRGAYETHRMGDSSLPHSTFLRFPGQEKNRIIALPAYLGGEFAVAGVKWIASFPANAELGMDRASAVVILNCAQTGRPQAILEGSIISAKRTAASAALAAQRLHGKEVDCLGLIGCGLIGFEIVRFLMSNMQVRNLVLFDTDMSRAEHFKTKCSNSFAGIEVRIAGSSAEVLGGCLLTALATTAVKPHISDLSAVAPGSTLLHVSLRDLTPEAILRCDNVADDIDHACRAQTSLHLAEQMSGNRAFIRCTLGDILRGDAPARKASDSITVFSPFGLGVLDLAVAKYCLDRAVEQNMATVLESFLPESWG